MGLNSKRLYIGLSEKEWSKFHSISAAIGVTPSTLGHIVLKQALFRYSSQEGLDSLVSMYASAQHATMQAVSLSRREIEVLNLMAQGFSNRRIANVLGIGEQATKNHVTSILRKLEVSNRTQAVLLALKYNLIEPQAIEKGDEPALAGT
jgi:DNA-binding NarL/FixJ family response regulator